MKNLTNQLIVDTSGKSLQAEAKANKTLPGILSTANAIWTYRNFILSKLTSCVILGHFSLLTMYKISHGALLCFVFRYLPSKRPSWRFQTGFVKNTIQDKLI